MKPLHLAWGFIVAAALPLHGQTNTVATDPVGYIRYVFQPNSDTAMSLPMQRPPEFQSGISLVGINSLTVPTNASVNWINNEWTYGVGTNASNTYYAQFTTGALEGAWFQVVSNNATTIFVDTAGLASLTGAGVTTNDAFKIVPFWTLASVFPNGTGIVAAANPFAPESVVFLNDETSPGINLAASTAYFFYNGSGGMVPAGWYPVGNPFAGKADDNPLNPDSYFRIRQPSTATTNFVPGAVAMHDFSTVLARLANGSQQDNFVGFGFPVDTTLAESGLQNSPGFTQSSNPFAPVDVLLIYDQASPGINKAPQQAYFYYDGSAGMVPSGWYVVGNPFAGSQDTNKVFVAGSGVIIRKAAGSITAATWTAAPNYAP